MQRLVFGQAGLAPDSGLGSGGRDQYDPCSSGGKSASNRG